jgi:hypothetical protein
MSKILRATIFGASLLAFGTQPVLAESFATNYASSYSGGMVWDNSWWPHVVINVEPQPDTVVIYEPAPMPAIWPFALQTEQSFARVIKRPPTSTPLYQTIKWQNEMEAKRMQAAH